MLGESRRRDAMGNARKNLLVGQVFDAISDGKKFVRLGDGLFDRGFSFDGAVLRHDGREIDSYPRGPVEKQTPAVAFPYQVEFFLPFNHFQTASSLQAVDGSKQLLLLMRWQRVEPLLIPIQYECPETVHIRRLEGQGDPCAVIIYFDLRWREFDKLGQLFGRFQSKTGKRTTLSNINSLFL